MSWSWIVPLICGWLAVGTQSSRKSIMRAVERADRALRHSNQTITPASQPASTAPLQLPSPPVATQQPSANPKTKPLIFAQRKVEDVPPKERFLFFWTYYGDQLEPGPTFNYARSHLFHTFADKVISAHKNGAPIRTYRPWPIILKHFLLACLFHFIPLTGAFIIAVESPTKGLGCRSGPLIIIFSASFLSALFHIFSAFLSQRWRLKKGTWLGYSAMLFLLLGKVTAYLNAAWFLIHCHFQFIGFYKRCWCWSCRIWLHDYAYINFLTNVEKQAEAVLWWASCFAIVTAGMMVYLIFFVVEGYKLHHPRKDIA
jgi:hypothetical protein